MPQPPNRPCHSSSSSSSTLSGGRLNFRRLLLSFFFFHPRDPLRSSITNRRRGRRRRTRTIRRALAFLGYPTGSQLKFRVHILKCFKSQNKTGRFAYLQFWAVLSSRNSASSVIVFHRYFTYDSPSCCHSLHRRIRSEWVRQPNPRRHSMGSDCEGTANG
jgi:hypothetical protein